MKSMFSDYYISDPSLKFELHGRLQGEDDNDEDTENLREWHPPYA